MARYGMQTNVAGSYEEVHGRVTAALKEQGFGILSEIDVQNTLQQKLGVGIEKYVILGACNPELAHQALHADRSIGLLLPCNVVLRAVDGEYEVSILDPEVMFEVTDAQTKASLGTVAREARTRLKRVVEVLSAAR